MVFKNREEIINNGETPELREKRRLVLDILTAAVEAVNPYNAVKELFQDNTILLEDENIDLSRYSNIYIVAFGKASVGMTQAVCDSISINRGVVITNDPNGRVECEKVDTVVGGHPIPNNGSINGAKQAQQIVSNCREDDLLLVLISGGGSALLCDPRIPLEDLQDVTNLLLRSGATINEINTIRKHLSHVKGGQLIQHVPCRVISLIISDIIGDPVEFIASGPTAPDSTTFEDAKRILEKYNLWNRIPDSARRIITNGLMGKIPETPKEDNEVFRRVKNIIVANNEKACRTAKGY
ncbi:MAG TPA: DUF4147 domain-containing protein, partial [Thermoplasmatales archaeon]|nr:DUF4147 domain-containing protein [Thermoplasmatales archaeon]